MSIPSRFSHTGVLSQTYLLKRLDSYVGNIAIRTVQAASKIIKNRHHSSLSGKILIIRPGGIGDAILLIPAIKALKTHFPSSEVHILAETRNLGVFSMVNFAKSFNYSKLQDLKYVLKNNYDIVIDTEQWHRLSAVLAYAVRSKTRIGFATNERKILFDHSIPYSQDRYELDSFFDLIRPIIGPYQEKPYSGFLSPPERTNPFGNSAFVAIFPGSSIPERMWPIERFKAIAEWLEKKLKFAVAVVGGSREYAKGEYIVNDLKRGINFAGKLALKGTASILSEASFLITSDSGLMHLAVALGSPVVALFGPGIEKKWAPRDRESIVINKRLPCSPCTIFGYTPPCKTNARCMKEIQVGDVKRAILEIISKNKD